MYSKIGLIGVGNMGFPLLRRLVNNNYKVNVFLEKGNDMNFTEIKNKTISKNLKIFQSDNYNNLYKLGSLKETKLFNEFICESDKIISVLPKSSITLDLVNKVEIYDNKVRSWLDLCSSCPKEVNSISNKLKDKGFYYLDAPVSGGPKGMENGKLTSIVSGDRDTFLNLYGLIKLYSENIYFISDKPGISSKLKLANNTLLAINLIGSAEILNILKNDDINIKKALKFINNSSGRNWATMQRYPDNIITGKYDYGFSYELHKKDVLTFLNNVEYKEDFILNVLSIIYKNENNKLSKNMDHTEIVKVIK